MMFLPLSLSSIGLLASICGIGIVRARSNSAPEAALRAGTMFATVIFVIVAWFLIAAMGLESNIWWSVICGAIGGIAIGLITEHYTGGPPVRRIAKSGETGPATVLITGLAVGMQSVVLPVLCFGGNHLYFHGPLRSLRCRYSSGGNASYRGYHHGH